MYWKDFLKETQENIEEELLLYEIQNGKDGKYVNSPFITLEEVLDMFETELDSPYEEIEDEENISDLDIDMAKKELEELYKS